MLEESFVMVKSDKVGIYLQILWDLDSLVRWAGDRVATTLIKRVPREIIEAHYEEHKGKEYYLPMIEYFTDKSVAVAVYRELFPESGIIEAVRRAIGAREPAKAEPWTIRGKYGGNESEELARAERRKVLFNVIHAADSSQRSRREKEIWREYLCLPS